MRVVFFIVGYPKTSDLARMGGLPEFGPNFDGPFPVFEFETERNKFNVYVFP